MNAVAGGGTILTFPTLLAFGMPSIQANATSTLALLVGIMGSLYGYRNHLSAAKPWLKNFAPVSMAGGLLAHGSSPGPPKSFSTISSRF